MNKARFEAFSDGVYAFAITLLALGFMLPAARLPSNADLTAALLSLWPNLVAYLLSFAVIGIMWQNHHALFRMVDRVDRQTVVWNFVLLAGTVFIPFATGTLGTYPTLQASAVLYGLTLSWTSTAYNLLLHHLVRSGSFARAVRSDIIAETVQAYRMGWVIYGLATLLGFFFPLVSIASYIAITLYYLVPRGLDSDLSAP